MASKNIILEKPNNKILEKITHRILSAFFYMNIIIEKYFFRG